MLQLITVETLVMPQDKTDILIATFQESDKSRLFSPTLEPSRRKIPGEKGQGEETTNDNKEERWGGKRTENDGDLRKEKKTQ